MKRLQNIQRWIGDQRHTATSSMLVILFIACFHVITTNGQQKGDEVCETLPSEIHLIKGIGIYRDFYIKLQFIN